MSTAPAQSFPDVPHVWCTDVDLAALPNHPLRPLAGIPPVDEVRVLVRIHGESLGFIQVPFTDGGLTAAAIVDGIGTLPVTARTRLSDHLAADGSPTAGTDDHILTLGQIPESCSSTTASTLTTTVVVCTRGRGESLRSCLAGLKSMKRVGLDFVIVDNAPVDDLTAAAFVAEVGDDSRFRYVVEPRPGLSCARNRGLAESTGDVVAYTDDDVIVDRRWVDALLVGFARRTDVACVTSLVCTAELHTASEHYFDARVSWADRCDPALYDGTPPEDDPLYPYYSPGVFGTGAGMAFRAEVLRELGGFDEALGAGTRTAGGEDLDAFVRVLQAGYAIAYEPSSLVWHHHRADLAGLRRQMYSYGTGLTAFFAKHLVDKTTRGSLLRKLPGGVRKLSNLPRKTSGAVGPALVPTRSLLIREFTGMAMGPALYFLARRSIPLATSTPRSENTAREAA